MESKNSGATLGAAITGVVVGAVAVALTHKPTRNKLKKMLDDTLDTGEEKINQIEGSFKKIKLNTKKRVKAELKKAQEKLD